MRAPETASDAMPLPLQHLYFIRHAETALAGTFCGQSDPPLNASGEAQLVKLVDRMSGVKLAEVYSSDLLRAHATALSIANPRSLAVQTSPALREISFGNWEALTWEQIEQKDAAYASRWVTEFPSLPTPGGEPISAFRQRVLEEVQKLRHRAVMGDLAIVTHAGVLRAVLESVAHFAAHHAWERTRDYTCVIHCTQTSPDGLLEVQL